MFYFLGTHGVLIMLQQKNIALKSCNKFFYKFKITSMKYFAAFLILLAELFLVGCGGGADTKSAAPTVIHLQEVSGSNQTTAVGTTLTDPIKVRVYDAKGAPLANIVVKFNVTKGDGHITSATATTGIDGRASILWTLGTKALEDNQLNASVDGASESINFSATSFAGPPVTVEKVLGDNQILGLSSLSPILPTVMVKDIYGNPVVPVVVIFKIVDGGGELSCGNSMHIFGPSGQATTINGLAACDWRLGMEYISNTISASIEGIASVTFTSSVADIFASIQNPPAKSIVGDVANIIANIPSKFQIASVVASVGSSSIALSLNNSQWTGNLIMPTQAPGDVSIVVTATDIFGTVSEASVQVRLDRAPVLTNISIDSFAAPKVNVSATCTDDDSLFDPTVQISTSQSILVSGSKTIAQQISLDKYEGQLVTLNISCKDSAGNVSDATRQVYVDSSSKLSVFAMVDGDILDVSGARVLFKKLANELTGLYVKNLTLGSIQTVASDISSNVVEGYLTPLGAIYRLSNDLLFDWNGEQIIPLNQQEQLLVAGNYALFVGSVPHAVNGERTLIRRNLLLQSNTLISTDPFASYRGIDLNSDGVVAYSANSNIYRYEENGTRTQLTTDGGSGYDNSYQNVLPSISGAKTVYIKANYIQPDITKLNWQTILRLVSSDGSNETIIYPALLPDSGITYKILNGFVGLSEVVVGSSGSTKVFRIDVSNNIEQVHSFGGFNTFDSLDAIGADGTVFFHNENLNKLYRAVKGQSTEEIGSSIGRLIYRNERPLIIMGGTALEVL